MALRRTKTELLEAFKKADSTKEENTIQLEVAIDLRTGLFTIAEALDNINKHLSEMRLY